MSIREAFAFLVIDEPAVNDIVHQQGQRRHICAAGRHVDIDADNIPDNRAEKLMLIYDLIADVKQVNHACGKHPLHVREGHFENAVLCGLSLRVDAFSVVGKFFEFIPNVADSFQQFLSCHRKTTFQKYLK